MECLSKSSCFDTFKSNLEQIVKTYYFGSACKLRGKGRLITIFSQLIRYLIAYGQVAVVNFGKYLLLAQIIEGGLTQTGWSGIKLRFFGDKDNKTSFIPEKNSFVIFKWGEGVSFSLASFKHDLEEIWNNRCLIGYDQKQSKKRIQVEFENDPGEKGWAKVFRNYHSENGFIGVISPKEINNPIKKWEFFQPNNSSERQQLHHDLDDAESRLFFQLGIRHNPFSKEERQNNPEVMSGQAYFFAWDIEHQEGIINGILDFLEKPWGGGEYTYQFGNLETLVIKKNEQGEAQVDYLVENTFSNNLPDKEETKELKKVKKLVSEEQFKNYE